MSWRGGPVAPHEATVAIADVAMVASEGTAAALGDAASAREHACKVSVRVCHIIIDAVMQQQVRSTSIAGISIAAVMSYQIHK
jgi:hypothetical protein